MKPQRAAPVAAAQAPMARRQPSETIVHGRILRDDYAWLKATNWREVLKDPEMLPPEIRAHLEAENAFAAALLEDSGSLRHALVAEMRAAVRTPGFYWVFTGSAGQKGSTR